MMYLILQSIFSYYDDILTNDDYIILNIQNPSHSYSFDTYLVKNIVVYMAQTFTAQLSFK